MSHHCDTLSDNDKSQEEIKKSFSPHISEIYPGTKIRKYAKTVINEAVVRSYKAIVSPVIPQAVATIVGCEVPSGMIWST